MGISNVSSGLRPGVCTSTTRPSAPFEGQMIYETDTDLTYIYGGSAWQQVSGGTAVGNSGLVYVTSYSFSAVTGVNIDNCFTSTYRNYMVVADVTTPTSDTLIYQLRASGTTNTGTNTDSLQAYQVWGSTTLYGNTLSNQNYAYFAYSNNNGAGTSLTLWGPQLAKYTMSFSENVLQDYRATSWSQHKVSTQYDGIRISTYSSAAITGNVTIYGYRTA